MEGTEFLKEHLKRVDKLLKKGKKFYYGAFVTSDAGTTELHTCGSMYCMEGFLPFTFPEYAEFDRLNPVVNTKGMDESFSPREAGIKNLPHELWICLTLPGMQDRIGEKNLTASATFRQVSQLWRKVIERMKSGETENMVKEFENNLFM